MGFFDSKSTTTNETTTQNTGFSDIGGSAVAIQGTGNRVQFTDQGALKLAGQIADRSFNQVELSNKSAFQGIAQAVDAVSTAAAEESENIVSNLKSLAFMGIIAWAVVGFSKNIR